MKRKIIIESNNFKCKQEHFILPNQKKHGEYKAWFSNGPLFVHCFYKDGKIDGEFKSWHNNGQLHIQCFYKNGKLEGEYKRYDNGQLYKYYICKDGWIKVA